MSFSMFTNHLLKSQLSHFQSFNKDSFCLLDGLLVHNFLKCPFEDDEEEEKT